MHTEIKSELQWFKDTESHNAIKKGQMFQEHYYTLQFPLKLKRKKKAKKKKRQKAAPKITLLLFKSLASQNSLHY